MDDILKKQQDKIKRLWQDSKERLTNELAIKKNLLYANLKLVNISPSAVEVIPEEEAKQARAVVFEKVSNNLRLGVVDPDNLETIKLIEKLKAQNYRVVIYVITEESLKHALSYYQFVKKRANEISNFIDVSSIKEIEFSNLNQELLNYPSTEVTSIIGLILKTAILIDASDIHIEPQSKTALIRFRVGGILYEVAEIDKDKYQKLLSRFKILSGIKLNITLSPQNGRFTIKNHNDFFDVRVSTLPGPEGEFIVCRILNPKRATFGLKDLGLREKDEKLLKEVMSLPNGMIILTGPTGSGKTTTLYALLKEKISPGIKIITIEDPIEYHINGVNQTQVSKDYTFETGLKSILRQDPDVIMIGEMRDKETVKIALQAALTGHLVLSTLHTNETAGAIDRLKELGADLNIIPGAVRLIVAQRLVRRLCPYCKAKYELTPEEKQQIIDAFSILSPKSGVKIPNDIPLIYKSVGCEKCHYLGYTSQIGLFEMMPITPKITEKILHNASKDEIRKTAIDEGMIPLFHDGLLKVMEGITSLEEIIRVAGDIEYVKKSYEELFSQTLLRGIKLLPQDEEKIEEYQKNRKPINELIENLPLDKQIHYLISWALKARATDIHFEPEEKQLVVRIRVDGILYLLTSFDLSEANQILNEIKSLSGLNTEETQKVQEGRFRIITKDKSLDVRVSILPSGYGESAVLRLLGSDIKAVSINNIGLLDEQKKIVLESLKDKVGLILTTGPTSSGKTTTLFALLKELNQPGVKIITVEDPIEYRLEGVNQTQVNEEKGYTFANALRTLLRQNPNIFLIGEIRDDETAKMAWQAALTGHLVLSTIHANDTLEVLPRLKSLGIEAPDIKKALRLVIAQRLVRKLCPYCKKEVLAPKELKEYIEHALDKYPSYKDKFKPPYKIYQPSGCEHCNFIGYLGQTAIFELSTPQDLEKDKPEFPRLIDSAIIKMLEGETSFEEIKRVLGI
ncbi:MAG: GspE/PulE family protein [Minisyncoccia bacterium]